MLGKLLFNLGSGASATTSSGGSNAAGAASGARASPTTSASTAQTAACKPVPSLDSVQEDIHMRNLLFPDAEALYQHRHDQVYPLSSESSLLATHASAASAFDYNITTDLDAQDVRVIIMQDTISSVTSSLLYDSQPPPPSPPPPPKPSTITERPSTMATGGASSATTTSSAKDARKTSLPSRKYSMGQAQRPVVVRPESPLSRQGAFDRRSSAHTRAQGQVESEAQRAWREYREEIAQFSSCIFGNSEIMGYKGISTKVHVVPSESRHTGFTTPPISDGRGSLGRASLRSSRLTQSSTSETGMPTAAAPQSANRATHHEQKKVLVTKLFPVNLLAAADDESLLSPQSRCSDDSSGFPFPHDAEDAKHSRKKRPPPRQKRTPMYAVALVITLPSVPASQLPITTPAQWAFRASGSYNEQDSLSSSFNSPRRSAWAMGGLSGYAIDSLDSAHYNDIEDRMDILTQHWDVIMRALTHLQSVVASIILTMLRQADLTTADPLPTSFPATVHLSRPTTTFTGRRSEDGAYVKSSTVSNKNLALLPNCLMDDERMADEVEFARTRIAAGLRASRVVTGQNRWGVWRDEARLSAKWAAGSSKEQGHFFFTILTAFLATHTDWLQALSPPKYRYRHQQILLDKREDSSALPARTVIVAHDKMSARRLVFLLSAFLPANQQLPTVRTHRPSTSASPGLCSRSPPTIIVPILKEDSLRRRINRRTGPRRASQSQPQAASGSRASPAVPSAMAHLSMEHGPERRMSDSVSIAGLGLPLAEHDGGIPRKSSATTTTVVSPDTTTVPHFSSSNSRLDHGVTYHHYQSSKRSSAAAEDLKRSLGRSESIGNSSADGSDARQSQWSVLGLFNTRIRESAGMTARARGSFGSRDPPLSPTTTVSISAAAYNMEALAALAKETPAVESPRRRRQASEPRADALSGTERAAESNSDVLHVSPEQAIPRAASSRLADPFGPCESTVKTSVNAEDGVIDVDIPFPELMSSFETAVSSPSSSGFLSTPGLGGSGLDAFEQSCRVSVEGDSPLNVAGWLQQYHPDFALQTIPPDRDLISQVKASLRAEPTPPLSAVHGASDGAQAERWVDASCAVIIDTTTSSIRRMRLRRLVRLRLSAMPSHFIPSAGAALATPSWAAPLEIQQLDEQFIEEDLSSYEEVLANAVQRVITVSGGVPSTTSMVTTSSQALAASSQQHGPDYVDATSQALETHVASAAASQEVPRGQCKIVILSALEEVVRDVIEKREKEGQGVSDGKKENPLREAVHYWLDSVDMGD